VIHWPVPHVPGIYDPARGELSQDGSRSYLDNLALADRTLGEVRTLMERDELWRDTAVLVTADHSWRTAPEIDRRVPFILRMPGGSAAIHYASTFNTALSAALVMDILEGRVNTAGDAGIWLDRARE
jgi:arylsulfatase A-like enzyme